MSTTRALAAAKDDKSCLRTNPNKMCRLCSKLEANDNLMNIFDSSETSLTIRIMACAGIEVSSQDALPKQICVECRLQLEKSFLFRNKCKNSDAKQRRHFRLVNAGKVSHVFDDSEDEYEDEYSESEKIIDTIEMQLANKRQESNERTRDEEIRKAVEAETKRIYTEAKEMFDEQLQRAMNRTEKRKRELEAAKPAPATRRRKTIKNDRTVSIEDVNVQIEEFIITEDGNVPAASEAGDDSNEMQDVETLGEFVDPIDYDPNEEELEAGDDDKDEDYVEAEAKARAGEQRNVQISEVNYTVLESGDLALESEQVDMLEGPESEEYLEEDDIDEKMDDKFDLESVLPVIKKTIASKSGIYLDDQTEYNFIRKPDNLYEVECITAEGKVYSVELIIDPQSTSDARDENIERDESGDLKVFKCEKCDASFARRFKLISHMREHENSNGYLKCSYCSKSFPSNSTLQRHVRVHTGEKPFKCEVCKRSFIQKEILKRHLMTHSGERPFKCDHCPKSFILKEALKQHVNRNHSENPVMELHKCPLCPKSFCHSSGLSRHLLIHAGKSFKCEYCDKPFNDRSALKRHTATIHNVQFKSSESPKPTALKRVKSELR